MKTKWVNGAFKALIAATLLMAGTAQATLISTGSGSTLLDISDDGQLLGALNVEVDGILYDVSFVDEALLGLYSSADDFITTTLVQAQAFAYALLDYVFVDVAEGLFDSDPTLTYGCEDAARCVFLTAWSFTSTDAINAAVAQNAAGSGGYTDYIYNGWSLTGSSGNAADGENSISAIWSLSSERSEITNDVPAPSSAALFACALLMMLWRKRNSSVNGHQVTL